METELRSEAGIAGQLFKSCVDLFWLLIQKVDLVKDLKQEQKSALQHEFGRFYFWGEGFDPENGRLDEILRLSASLRDQTILLLMDVGRTLSSRETGSLPSSIWFYPNILTITRTLSNHRFRWCW